MANEQPKYNYYLVTYTWSDLTMRLEDLDAAGFEIFAICPLGGSDFVNIVYRKWRARL